jgi:uncharacterized LabA/DUF88 family protein
VIIALAAGFGQTECRPFPSMTAAHPNSIALLIDADNAPAGKIAFILSELASHGVVNVRRAYGNWTKADLAGWVKVLHEHSIQPMQSFDLIKGKNATDMALVIDAMDLLYTKKLNTFCLVSSDCDFTPLIQRLRADGKDVFGFGEQKTPEPFIAACTRFIYLEEPPAKASAGAKAKPDTQLQTGQNLKSNTKLINTLRNAVKASADEEGWANLSNIANRINNESPLDHRTYGFTKLSDLFEAIDLFNVKREKNATQTVVYVRIAKVGGKKIKVKPHSHDEDIDIPF